MKTPTPVRRFSIRITLALLASLTVLGTAELLLRAVAPQPLSGSWLEDSGHGYLVNRPGAVAAHANATRRVEYRINDLGFRGAPVRPARRRVLVLGDSATFGWLLQEDDTYVSRLGRAVNQQSGPGDIEFMNAAVGGWGTAEYVAFLEDRGGSIPAFDAVLVFLSGDETRRSMASGLWRLTPDGALTRQPQRAGGPAIRAINALPGYRYLIARSHLAALVRATIVNRMSGPLSTPLDDVQSMNAETAAGIALHTALLQRLQDWCARRATLMVVATGFVNLHEHTADEQTPFAMNRQFTDRAPAFFASRGISFLDLVPEVERAIDRSSAYRIPLDLHPSEEGARLVADLSWPWLRDRLAARLP